MFADSKTVNKTVVFVGTSEVVLNVADCSVVVDARRGFDTISALLVNTLAVDVDVVIGVDVVDSFIDVDSVTEFVLITGNAAVVVFIGTIACTVAFVFRSPS